MPGLNGYQVLARLKKDERTAHIPVIILSALSRETDILEGLDRGATDYLTKPFSPEILLSKIKKVLSTKNDDSNLHRSL
jgi:DNA-binding response OmpR family regulator